MYDYKEYLRFWKEKAEYDKEYNQRDEKQLIGYLVDRGICLVSALIKNKQIVVYEIVVGDKSLIEAVV